MNSYHTLRRHQDGPQPPGSHLPPTLGRTVFAPSPRPPPLHKQTSLSSGWAQVPRCASQSLFPRGAAVGMGKGGVTQPATVRLGWGSVAVAKRPSMTEPGSLVRGSERPSLGPREGRRLNRGPLLKSPDQDRSGGPPAGPARASPAARVESSATLRRSWSPGRCALAPRAGRARNKPPLIPGRGDWTASSNPLPLVPWTLSPRACVPTAAPPTEQPAGPPAGPS